MNVVVSQPMFFPWIGIFEQIRLADVFIHYDDVQLPRGRSFVSRVQIKTPNGTEWLSAPVRRESSNMSIREARFCDETDWRAKHLRTLERNYAAAPFSGEMLALAREAYAFASGGVADFNIHAISLLCRYFGLTAEFDRSSKHPTERTSSEHLLHLVQSFQGDTYITGHGAKAYIDHELFDRNGIAIHYMNYRRTSYPQRFGPFDPHVSMLDVVANCGPAGRDLICSGTVNWKDFIYGQEPGV
ncbi:MAG: WbqC family protein [Chthoniobacterales bacterium]|nr:WbqC family protein [Chthoniobacterales bacterium]